VPASTTRARLEACLSDVDFPVGKDELTATAERHGDLESARAAGDPFGRLRQADRGLRRGAVRRRHRPDVLRLLRPTTRLEESMSEEKTGVANPHRTRVGAEPATKPPSRRTAVAGCTPDGSRPRSATGSEPAEEDHLHPRCRRGLAG
jgi:hypothetical protein